MVDLLTHFAAGQCGDQTFLGLEPWYHYLNFQMENGACQLPDGTFNLLGTHSSLILILLALTDDLIRIVGLLSVVYVIISGIKYIMSRGSPDEVAKAQTGIMNALAGLAISVVSIKFVAFLAGQFSDGNGGQSANGLDLTTLPNPQGVASGTIVPTLLTVVFTIAGALSFLFLVIGGFGYVSSQGDPQRIAKAKSTVTYALVGIIVAVSAESIVGFALGKL